MNSTASRVQRTAPPPATVVVPGIGDQPLVEELLRSFHFGGNNPNAARQGDTPVSGHMVAERFTYRLSGEVLNISRLFGQ